MTTKIKILIVSLVILTSGITSVLYAQSVQPLHEQMQGKSGLERVGLIAKRIEKIGSIPKTQRDNYDIEILSISTFEKGVEVFARAWDKQGKQIGFGEDGTVDIERFIFVNPDYRVEDTLGTIEVTSFAKYVGFVTTRYREDTREWLLQALEETLAVKKEKSTEGKIIAGKVGNTTTTVYPDANPESTSVDGNAEYTGAGLSWANVRAAAGNASNDTGTLTGPIWNVTSGSFDDNIRGLVVWDTSSIPDTETISSATASFKGTHKFQAVATSVVVAAGTTASATSLANGDYESNVGPALWSDTSIAVADWSITGYNDFALNATGIAAISKTGVTKFSTLTSNDQSNTDPGTTAGVSGAYYNQADNGSNQPKLVIESSAVEAGGTTVSPQFIFLE